MLNFGIRFPELLIWFPLIAGLISFIMADQKRARSWALLSSIITLGFSVASLFYADNKELSGQTYTFEWMKYVGANFAIALDGTGRLLTSLTAVAFPLIFVATYNNKYKNAPAFYGLMLLAQSGLMGVFCASDVLVFYFFWELALIPVYFLCSRWGGERRIQATFKFFIYTFTGSLLMLVGIIYVYMHTGATAFAPHSFSMKAFYTAQLTMAQQNWLFWLFFAAFAIKMPVFPFHTWQPDTYEQSPAAATMVLSGIMVKMGVFALLRWLLPVFPQAAAHFSNLVIGLSVTGMLYASLLAMRQDDLKRLVAYSSIAHIGLMCAAIFAANSTSVQGVMVQMFAHGLNIIGMWIVIEMIERQTGIRKISQLGGLAHQAPVLTTALVIIALANIALPLTNAFVGEFMMFSGLFKYNVWFAAVAGISIILAAVYTLTMVQKVFYGPANATLAGFRDIAWHEKIILAVMILAIFIMGVFPQPVIELTKDAVTQFITKIK
ncbi:MAG: NADH-quinone oxidoreductase subunit M [Ferruginibacter sp.]